GVQWFFQRDRELAAFMVGEDFRVVYDDLGRTHSFRHGARVSDRAEVDRAGDAKSAALLGLAARRSTRIGGPPLNSDWRPAAQLGLAARRRGSRTSTPSTSHASRIAPAPLSRTQAASVGVIGMADNNTTGERGSGSATSSRSPGPSRNAVNGAPSHSG